MDFEDKKFNFFWFFAWLGANSSSDMVSGLRVMI